MMFFFGCAVAAIAWAIIVYVLVPMISNPQVQNLVRIIMIILGIFALLYVMFLGIEFARGGPGPFAAWPR
jgi:hypothetical protein